MIYKKPDGTRKITTSIRISQHVLDKYRKTADSLDIPGTYFLGMIMAIGHAKFLEDPRSVMDVLAMEEAAMKNV